MRVLHNFIKYGRPDDLGPDRAVKVEIIKIIVYSIALAAALLWLHVKGGI